MELPLLNHIHEHLLQEVGWKQFNTGEISNIYISHLRLNLAPLIFAYGSTSTRSQQLIDMLKSDRSLAINLPDALRIDLEMPIKPTHINNFAYWIPDGATQSELFFANRFQGATYIVHDFDSNPITLQIIEPNLNRAVAVNTNQAVTIIRPAHTAATSAFPIVNSYYPLMADFQNPNFTDSFMQLEWLINQNGLSS